MGYVFLFCYLKHMVSLQRVGMVTLVQVQFIVVFIVRYILRSKLCKPSKATSLGL